MLASPSYVFLAAIQKEFKVLRWPETLGRDKQEHHSFGRDASNNYIKEKS